MNLTANDIDIKFRRINKPHRVFGIDHANTTSLTLMYDVLPKTVNYDVLGAEWEITRDQVKWYPATLEGMVDMYKGGES